MSNFIYTTKEVKHFQLQIIISYQLQDKT